MNEKGLDPEEDALAESSSECQQSEGQANECEDGFEGTVHRRAQDFFGQESDTQTTWNYGKIAR
eukprot:2504728-Amphidinium_carterae.1